MKNLNINNFNKSNSLLVISGWPKKKELYSKGVCAVSSFAKNTLTTMQKENPDRKIVVLTMEIDKRESYVEDGILIIRCFKRNSPLSFLNLFRNILKFNKAKDVLIEFEFASFGDMFTTGLLIPLTFALFFLKKDIKIVVHQVLDNIKDLSGHIGISKNNPKITILNYALKCFYILLTAPASKVFVLEEEFKQRLSKLTNPKKIVIIPHGIDTNIQIVNRNIARKNLGLTENDYAILYFGYLTWYKGADFLVKTLKNAEKINGKKIKLILAGGPSFTQEEKTHYQTFLSSLKKQLKGSKNIITTGFVKEEDITPIFEASDLAVFPYRTFMSASGPLSLAVSHNKPFVISENMEPFLNSIDIKNAMNLSQINRKDLIFKMNKLSLIKTIKNVMNKDLQQKMILFSKIISEERSFANSAKTYNRFFVKESKKVNALYNLIPPDNE